MKVETFFLADSLAIDTVLGSSKKEIIQNLDQILIRMKLPASIKVDSALIQKIYEGVKKPYYPFIGCYVVVFDLRKVVEQTDKEGAPRGDILSQVAKNFSQGIGVEELPAQKYYPNIIYDKLYIFSEPKPEL